ncbi:hypothetical protein BH23ACT5_BH23ACT5_21840 [soil metagenome]
MKRPPWPVAVAAVVGLAVVVVVQFGGAARTILWVGLTIGSMTWLGWRRWPERPRQVPLFATKDGATRSRAPHSLAAIEIEVAGAIDEGIREASRLQRRLSALGERRTGAPVERVLVGEGDVMSLGEIERVVTWLERS